MSCGPWNYKNGQQKRRIVFSPVWSLSVDRCQLRPLSYIYMVPPFIVPFVKGLWTCPPHRCETEHLTVRQES